MDLDTLLRHYLGTDDPAALSDVELADGRERVAIAFGVEREPSRRFALWALLHALGDAPDPAAFKDPQERRAAERYARAAERLAEP